MSKHDPLSSHQVVGGQFSKTRLSERLLLAESGPCGNHLEREWGPAQVPTCLPEGLTMAFSVVH